MSRLPPKHITGHSAKEINRRPLCKRNLQKLCPFLTHVHSKKLNI